MTFTVTYDWGMSSLGGQVLFWPLPSGTPVEAQILAGVLCAMDNTPGVPLPSQVSGVPQYYRANFSAFVGGQAAIIPTFAFAPLSGTVDLGAIYPGITPPRIIRGRSVSAPELSTTDSLHIKDASDIGRSLITAADQAAVQTIVGASGGGGTPTDGSVTFPKLAAAAVVTAAETIAANNNDTTIPTSAAVQAAITAAVTALLNGAPGALNTLKELADAINDDASFAASITTALSGKQPLDSDLTTLAGLTATTDSFIQSKSGAWSARTVAQVKSDLGTAADDATVLASATTAINTQAIVEVPQLLRPTTPQPTRFPYGSKIQTVFASGHGWTKNASGTGSTGTVADDTTNFTNGSQSLGITTAGVSVNTFAVSPAFSPTLDLSKNALVLKLRVNTWANLAQVEVLISNDATTAMGTTRATSGALASSASLLAADGEFFWVVVNPGQWTNQFSTVDKTAVTRVGVLPASNASGAVTVNVQEVWTRPGPSLPATVITFDDGYLTQLTQAKPYMDKYGFRGVCYPIRNLINNASSTYMSVANLQALYDCGWDVSAHSDTAAAHDSANALLDSSISDGTASALSSFERELHDNKQWLLANGFNRSADFFAWPQGKFDAARLAIAREYYTLIRVYRPALTVADADTYPFVDGGRLRQIAVQSGGSPTAAATVTAALTAAWAAGKTVVLTFHGLGSVNTFEYPVASFQTIIDFIASSGYPVKTLSAIMRDNGIDTPVGKTDLATKLTIPTGTPDGTKYARDDGTYAVPPGTGGLPSQTGNSGKYLTTDGTTASWGVGASGSVTAQLFTASGTYTAPATGIYRRSAVGGGGSGGAGGSALTSGGVATQAAGAGGGSGEYVEDIVSLTAGDTLTITIGTGGAASTGGVLNGNAGTGGAAGVSTTVVGTTTLTARGGSAGGNGGANTVTAPNPGAYGSGGTTINTGSAGTGGQTTTASGFQGGAGIGLVAKGGGGGTPANASNGGNGSTGAFSSGHTGTTTGGNGSSVTANTGAGGNGGGGGAPGGAGGNGSAGASGLVLIERIA